MTKGYKANTRTESNFEAECPTPEQRLEQLLKRWKGRVPACMPSDPFQAARWWMAHQEPAEDWKEQAEKIWDGAKFCGWATPYHDRLEYTLGHFLRLKSYHQEFIVEAHERGIPWRGEPVDVFLEVVKQADIMAADPEGYRKAHEHIAEQFKDDDQER